MAKNKQLSSPEAADASFLPGCSWNVTIMPVKSSSSKAPPLLWWVHPSATQVISPKSGLPIGFKHTLMNGKKAGCSGIGADAGRTLRYQAEYLNGVATVGGALAPPTERGHNAAQSGIHRP